MPLKKETPANMTKFDGRYGSLDSFDYSLSLSNRLASVRHRQGRLTGRVESLNSALRAEAVLETLTENVVQSCAINGEIVNRDHVRSSVTCWLDMQSTEAAPADQDLGSVVESVYDATRNFDKPLCFERLSAWHAALLPLYRKRANGVGEGERRKASDRARQELSGRAGRKRADSNVSINAGIDAKVSVFLEWFELNSLHDPVIKAGIAYLWFVNIHPFNEGNGRVARAIVDLALARSENSAELIYCMSGQMWLERGAQRELLESTESADFDVTRWLTWFIDCLNRAIDGAERLHATVWLKASFWSAHGEIQVNGRQRVMINRLLGGLEGKLTTSKWGEIARCSHDTALRDIEGLIEHSVLTKADAGGRNTSYRLADFGAL